MKIIFFGSSEFSLHALNACLEKPFEVSLILTTPAQKKGRGLVETPTPVQEFAQSKQLPWSALENLKSPEILDKVQALKPELFVVSSYGKMIPSTWLKVPSRYALNVHPSLLPKYRGAAPIHWPLILGDTETGVSIAEVTPALDAGDIFYQMRIPIPPEINSIEMTNSLGGHSKTALATVLQSLLTGELKRTAQNHSLSNYARKLSKDDGRVNWNRSAIQLANQVRGLLPWPVVSISYEADSIQILNASSIPASNSSFRPGQVAAISKDSLEIQTGDGILALKRLRPAGKKEMSGGDYARGRHLKPGDLFPSDPHPPNFVLRSPA